MIDEPGRIQTSDLLRRIDLSASQDAEFVFGSTADGILERLQPVEIQPRRVLDLGCGAGARTKQLAVRFPRSEITGLDFSARMLGQARTGRGWLQRSVSGRPRVVCGDAVSLPFLDDSIDLIFANLLLPFVDDIAGCLADAGRVLRPEGLLAFSTLGPDSFTELREAWASIGDRHDHVRSFPDMHHVGDALLRSGMRDPVLDVDYLTVRYTDFESLYRDLSATGARNCLQGRAKGLTGRRVFRQLEARLLETAADDRISITLELVFGHAWGASSRSSPSEYKIVPDQIGRRSR